MLSTLAPAETAIATALMQAALAAAQTAWGRTAPNPMVGCIIAHGARIVGSGAHVRCGAPHAEVVALSQAGAQALGADVYVTLEPCDHQGRTGPCTKALIAARVARVFVGSRDPNPIVDGRGIAALQAAGIQVVTGVLTQACTRLNEAFNHAITSRRAFGVVKLAQSLDGCVASRTGASQWITGAKAREDGHRWRNRLDAVVVGIETVLADDPQLTCRLPEGRDPRRVVLDARGRTPLGARVLRPGPSADAALGTSPPARPIVCVGPEALAAAVDALAAHGAEVWRCPANPFGPQGIDVRYVSERLFCSGMLSMLIEGGPTVQGAFFDAQCVERVIAYVAPMLLGGKGAKRSLLGHGPGPLGEAPRLVDPLWQMLDADMSMTGRVAYGRAQQEAL